MIGPVDRMAGIAKDLNELLKTVLGEGADWNQG
jgi:hypothetical protein